MGDLARVDEPHEPHEPGEHAGHDTSEEADRHLAFMDGAPLGPEKRLGRLDVQAWTASIAGVAIGVITAVVFWLATR